MKTIDQLMIEKINLIGEKLYKLHVVYSHDILRPMQWIEDAYSGSPIPKDAQDKYHALQIRKAIVERKITKLDSMMSDIDATLNTMLYIAE